MTLRWLRRALFLSGTLAIAYCLFVLAYAEFFQRRQSRELDAALRASSAMQSATQTQPPLAAGLIGRLEIPRLGISSIVLEGTTASTLRRAVGHIAGTPLPGQVGNSGFSAHRDTYFRPLRNIRRDDVITVTTQQGTYRYRVLTTRIVLPSNVGVLDQGSKQVLTLVTCYPFYYIGSAPNRFIVRAEREI